jgi:hypothetical protein
LAADKTVRGRTPSARLGKERVALSELVVLIAGQLKVVPFLEHRLYFLRGCHLPLRIVINRMNTVVLCMGYTLECTA